MPDDTSHTPSDDTLEMHRRAKQQIDDLERRITDVERGVKEQLGDDHPQPPPEDPLKPSSR
jgi:hypothetical protein